MGGRTIKVAGMNGKSGKRTLVIWCVLAGLAIIGAANAHLVYVAVTSDPDCLLSKSDAAAADKKYRPVKSGC